MWSCRNRDHTIRHKCDHATPYEFLRNSALDARSLNEMPGANHLVHNNFGLRWVVRFPGKRPSSS